MNDSIRFFLFAYFGITETDTCEQILISLIDRAYQDASSHVLSFIRDGDRDNHRNKGLKLIKDKLYDSIPHTSWEKFTAWHSCLCNELVNEYPESSSGKYQEDANGNLRPFTYGIAQKWVNMTLKYCIILFDLLEDGELRDFQKIGAKVTSCRNFLHIPLDSYMLSAIKKDLDCNIELAKKSAWSKIREAKDYNEFQEKIRDAIKESKERSHLSPFDWEGTEWIKFARQARYREMVKKYPEEYKSSEEK